MLVHRSWAKICLVVCALQKNVDILRWVNVGALFAQASPGLKRRFLVELLDEVAVEGLRVPAEEAQASVCRHICAR